MCGRRAARRDWNPRIAGAALGALAALAPLTPALGAAPSAAKLHAPRVLQVGTYHGHKGAYATVQSAVDAAVPGDWILIAPGDYHENGNPQAGVWVTTPGIHLRGMDRNAVIVDGTNAGSNPCSADPAVQNFGINGAGRNGVEIYQADGVSVENLTVCNFMGDAYANQGNQIWWNGGDGSGQIGLGPFRGAYLTASSTFHQTGNPQLGQYGIFVSNSRGPGVIENSYASNMSDSAFYIGACPDCNATLRFVHAQNSAQGYSGSNSGGHLVLEYSEWDHNQAGIVPSSLASFDPPAPQDGACPHDALRSCTLIQFNLVHDNNNPNTPAAGLAQSVAVGTGIDLSGGRNNTVQFNAIERNGSWGVLLNDYADFSPPAAFDYCGGGTVDFTPPSPYDQLYGTVIPCFFNSYGNRVDNNVFWGNGFYGNETNGDLANAAVPYVVNNCFVGNIDLAGAVTSSPNHLQTHAVAGQCGRLWNPDTTQEVTLIEQLGCASLGLCAGLPPPLYPVQTQVVMFAIPREPTMQEPCAGAPANTWCTEDLE